MSKLLCNACHSHKEQARKPVRVPFVWEEKPGQPNRNLNVAKPTIDIPQIPPRQVISIPFQWEERPGKPRTPSPQKLESILPCSSITSIREEEAEGYDDDDDDHDDDDDSDANEEDGDPDQDKGAEVDQDEDDEEEDDYEDDEDDDDHDDELFELDLESFAFDENHLPVNSFSASTPALLANCMSTLSEISCAIPVERLPCETEESSSSGSEQGASGSEDDSSSYIEFIFPLASPRESSFLEKVFAMENRISESSRQASGRHSCCRVKCVKMKSMPPNFGHLMFTSKIRRPKMRSRAKETIKSAGIQDKNHGVQHKKHVSFLLVKKRAVCCPFGAGHGTPKKRTTVLLGWWRKKNKEKQQQQQNESIKQPWWRKRKPRTSKQPLVQKHANGPKLEAETED